MKETKNNISTLIIIIFMIAIMWVSLTTLIQRFSNPHLTETELFLNIPKSFILDFNN